MIKNLEYISLDKQKVNDILGENQNIIYTYDNLKNNHKLSDE